MLTYLKTEEILEVSHSLAKLLVQDSKGVNFRGQLGGVLLPNHRPQHIRDFEEVGTY